MRVKTSITLSSWTIAANDEFAGPDVPRSRIVEQAVLEFVERRLQLREAGDLEILNRSAERLNRETEDVLAFQAPVTLGPPPPLPLEDHGNTADNRPNSAASRQVHTF